ncbi:uncharacterized protein LY89DRAFT_665084 [Mollisia scopiformis]|uniref:Uncharacterized protein n=1 Tax=Mollisia scopiformis TaxID=149040 RepID=A0A194XP22_MOLSC|nr:uncharacterized protein LY89DRAFT_665084 [Mollisia scopiformis]KUJ21933.1 hypothetical protein LY89DRAFT_665084 [Mollisia scopiformis]
MFTPTLGNLPLLLLFVISTATPFLPSHFSTRQDPDGPCTCYTDQSGLYCGSRSDGSDNASLAGPWRWNPGVLRGSGLDRESGITVEVGGCFCVTLFYEEFMLCEGVVAWSGLALHDVLWGWNIRGSLYGVNDL